MARSRVPKKREPDKYQEFLRRKAIVASPAGIEPGEIRASLFPFQAAAVRWALRRGRAALFFDCGLGKTLMQLEWASQIAASGHRVLIVAPLAVTSQTVAEGRKFGIDATYARSSDEMGNHRIVVTNYERLDAFDSSRFGGVVLDESSIIKHQDSATRQQVMEMFGRTPYRIACTATPAPNDHVELANHADFCGVMTRAEMLATWFVHDGGETQSWRLKGHAVTPFWEWVASWALIARKPSDIGFDDSGYDLPSLKMREVIVESDHECARDRGLLFNAPAVTLAERRDARKATIGARVRRVADEINASSDQWIVWVNLNAEGDAATDAIDGAVQISGSDDEESRAAKMAGFIDGTHRVLVSKPSIAGFGVNLQNCARVAFIGLSDSWEQFYQAIRRCWRFGQTREVECLVVVSDIEGAVLSNIQRKEAQAAEMFARMVAGIKDIQSANVTAAARQSITYHAATKMEVPSWLR